MDMVFGCGIDIEEISRFEKHIKSDDSSLIEDFCTQRELNNLCGDRRVRVALSFSCKEAFFKALGVSWTNSNIFWKDIELIFYGSEFTDFSVHLSAYAQEMLVKNDTRIEEVSFDYNEEIVMFQVVLLKNMKMRGDFINIIGC